MGILDKIKAATNAITGGAANVTLEIGPGSLREGVHVRVHADARASVRISSVYIDFQGTEHATVRNVRQHSHLNSMGNTGEVKGTTPTAQQRVTLAGPQDLVEGQRYTWEQQCALPAGLPSLRGQTIGYVWTARAGVDAPGNDPDSGWIVFEVSA